MPVIGRMDTQVWETLSAPIARRHEREAPEEQEKQEELREEETRAEAEKKETK